MNQMEELQKRIQELEAAQAETEKRVQKIERQMQTMVSLTSELYKSQSIEQTVEILSDLGKSTLDAEKSDFWCVDTIDNKVFTVEDNQRKYADLNSDILLKQSLEEKATVIKDDMAAIPIKATNGTIMGVVIASNGDFNKEALDKFTVDGEIGAVCGLALEKERQHQEGMTDKLTNLKNRKGLEEYSQNNITRTLSNQKDVTLVMCDIDHFKSVNDTYGHDAGDKVLQTVAKILKDNIRSNDNVFRQGGEEFVVAFDNTDKAEAFVIADRIRAAIQNTPINIGDKSINITISMGIEQIVPDKTPTKENIMDTIDKSLKAADTRLYEAKETGRNRVVADVTKEEIEQAQVRRKNDEPNKDDVVYKKIIGNTPYNQLGVKADLMYINNLNNRHAENIGKKLAENGVKYSGVVLNDKTTITINKADKGKYYDALSDVKQMYSNKTTRDKAVKIQEKAEKTIEKTIEAKSEDKSR